MSRKKIIVYPEITAIVIEEDNVSSITQGYNNSEKLKQHLQECIKIVKKYEALGYYNLKKPEFIDDVIITFSNLELSKKEVMRINNYMDIVGFPECNRIWQLSDEMKVQASNMLCGFVINFDSNNWEALDIEPI